MTTVEHQPTKSVVHDNPSKPPQESLHWKRVVGDDITANQPKDLINSHEELIKAFQTDVSDVSSIKSSSNNKLDYTKLALWSIIIGYCEALATHKDETRRFSIFPIPLSALRNFVDEFVKLLNGIPEEARNIFNAIDKSNKSTGKQINESTTSNPPSLHRCTVQSLSNSIWKRAQNKSQMKDELHANSLYICLCGDVDNKSLDCFGAALITVIGMNILGYNSSCLTLSEDHAYESHWEESGGSSEMTAGRRKSTCEIAIPGNTKASQCKRGKEISHTFAELRYNITPDTSWLYMASNAVVCDTPGMVLGALLGNVNCDVEKLKKTSSSNDEKPQVVSEELYKLKRDMLWILYDAGFLARFPFALMELGECEEHFGSKRGMQWVDIRNLITTSEGECNHPNDDQSQNEVMALWNEKLFLDAVHVSQAHYGDAQVYPYLYAGHYHKDAGRKSSLDEHRLVEALRLYSEASKVACRYKYETKDSMQLIKHMTTVATLIQKDILLFPDSKEVRVWTCREHAVAASTFILAYFDSLLFWEEREESTFIEILGRSHKLSLPKLFQHFPQDIRLDGIAKLHNPAAQTTKYSAITEHHIFYFTHPRARRLAKGSLLVTALSKEKISVRDLDMALPASESHRQRKRCCRGSD